MPRKQMLVVGTVALAFVAGVVQGQAERFELEGNMKLFGTGNGIIFPDGTKQTSAGVGTAGDVSCVGCVDASELSFALRHDPACFDNTSRYVDCGNGTVTDTVTRLVWLKDSNCLGSVQWAAANQAAAGLAAGQCGLTDGSRAGDWRLPTEAEWQAMTHAGRSIVTPACTAPALTKDDGITCFGNGSLASFAPLVGTGTFWSSSSSAADPDLASAVALSDGGTSGTAKTNGLRVWPVRAGGPASPPAPRMVGGGSEVDFSPVFYAPMFGDATLTFDSAARTPVAAGGTLSNLEVYHSGILPSGDFVHVVVRKNGSNTSLRCSVSINSLFSGCSDRVNTVALAAGDLLSISIDSDISSFVRWSALYTP